MSLLPLISCNKSEWPDRPRWQQESDMMRNTRGDMMKRTMVVGALALLLGACSSVPKELAYEPENQLVAYQPALGGMEGKPARWSGVISAGTTRRIRALLK